MGTVGRSGLLLIAALLVPACTPPPRDPPRAPTTLVATPATSGRIDLTWIDSSSKEQEFRVERSDDGGLTYALVATLPMNTQAYSDLGLLPSRAYFYRVYAWTSLGGSSTFAGPANATTKPLVWNSGYTGAGTPGIRSEHSAIYDSLGKRMILFGGQDDAFTWYNDVWSLDLSQPTSVITQVPLANFWAPLTTTGTPPSIRTGHSAIYDVQNNRMIVFGGQDNTLPAANSYRFDVHILTLGATPTWSAAGTTGTAPSGRLGHTAVYDAAHQRMVIFGGNDAGGEKADAFYLSLPPNPPFAWSNAPAGPIKRTNHSAIYDGFRQQMVLFGGLDHDQLLDGTDLNAETWILSLSGPVFWIQQSFLGTPQFRRGHSAVYDAPNQRMVMFGGDTTFGPSPTASDELWGLQLNTGARWMILAPTSGALPPARYGHSAVYDSGFQRMIVYGGYDSSFFAAFADTWLSDF